MSTELLATDAPAVEATDTALCDACHHPEAAHDRISSRYCAATMAAVSSRACICAGQ